MGGNGLYDQNIRSGCCYSKENEFHFLGTNLSHYGSGWSHLRFFDSAVSCEAISGSAASSVCKCCKGTVSHGRLPVFYIVQTNFVNAQGESWTGEMDDRNLRQKHIEKMPGCRVSRHPGFSSQITSQAASVQHSVQLPLPPVDPVNPYGFRSLDDI